MVTARYFTGLIHGNILISRLYGIPNIIQCDQGGEFKGILKKAIQNLGVKVINSRARHPQSQGKCERSHGTWKMKLQYDLLNESNPGMITFFMFLKCNDFLPEFNLYLGIHLFLWA